MAINYHVKVPLDPSDPPSDNDTVQWQGDKFVVDSPPPIPVCLPSANIFLDFPEKDVVTEISQMPFEYSLYDSIGWGLGISNTGFGLYLIHAHLTFAAFPVNNTLSGINLDAILYITQNGHEIARGSYSLPAIDTPGSGQLDESIGTSLSMSTILNVDTQTTLSFKIRGEMAGISTLDIIGSRDYQITGITAVLICPGVGPV